MTDYATKLTLERTSETLAETIAKQLRSSAPQDQYVVIDANNAVLNYDIGTFILDISRAARVPEEFDPRVVGGIAVVPASEAAKNLIDDLCVRERGLLDQLQALEERTKIVRKDYR